MADTSLIFNIIARDQTSATFDKIKAGAAVAGAAIGAGLAAAAGLAIEKSKLDNKVAAQLGATPEQAAQIGKLSGSVYAAGFGEDMPGVTAAIKAGAQNGLLSLDGMSKEAAQKTTENLLTVGSILEEDSERVSSAVSQMLRTGMAKSAEEAMDLLVVATQKGVNKSQDLLDTTNEYSTQFRKLGLDGPQSMGLMSQAIQAGARDSDTAADALKEFSIRAIDGSKAAASGYEALGMSAEGMTAQMAQGGEMARLGLTDVLDRLRAMEDPVKRDAAAVGLFGTKAEDLGAALFAMDVDTAAAQMGSLAGATDKAGKTAASGAASWSTFQRQAEMALVDTLNKAAPAMNAVLNFLQKNSQWLGPIAIALGVAAAAVAVVTAAQWAWNIAVAANPIGLLILAIGAVVAAIIIAVEKTVGWKNIWNSVWGFFKSVGAWFSGPFVNFFVTAWNRITSSLNRAKGQWNSAVNAVRRFFTGMKNGVVNSFNGIVNKGNSVVSWFRSMPGKIRGALTNLFRPMASGFKGTVNSIIRGWNNLSFTIGGGSFAGISIPSATFGTPNLPYLATGGDIQRTGMAVVHRGERITKAAVARRTGPGAGSGGGGQGATIRVEGSNAKVIRVLLELLREGIRDKGGDPVKVLTSS